LALPSEEEDEESEEADANASALRRDMLHMERSCKIVSEGASELSALEEDDDEDDDAEGSLAPIT
jgi:hypothetical protein